MTGEPLTDYWPLATAQTNRSNDPRVLQAVRAYFNLGLTSHRLQDPWVGLRQFLSVGLPDQSSSNVLMQKTDDITLFWVKIRSAGTTGSHDSQRESQNHKGSHDHPVGGGRNAG